MMLKPLNVAVLDMYDGLPNEGMRCIKSIVHEFALNNNRDLQMEVYDVRGKNEMADLGFDIYISSGGPGSPLDSEGSEW
ncbi:MAG: GMP synthase, partial [Bacteroidota bacterium]